MAGTSMIRSKGRGGFSSDAQRKAVMAILRKGKSVGGKAGLFALGTGAGLVAAYGLRRLIKGSSSERAAKRKKKQEDMRELMARARQAVINKKKRRALRGAPKQLTS